MKAKKLVLISFTVASLVGCSLKTDAPQPNNLISYYETLKLQKAVETSFNKNVLEKKGYPNGYDLTFSPSKKEINLTIKPYSKKNYNYLKGDLQKDMEKVLDEKNSNYHAKVSAYWEGSHDEERKIQEEKVLQEVENEMLKRHQVEALPGTRYAAADGHTDNLTLTFMQNNKEITDPIDINNYRKEFVKIAKEKGLDLSQMPMTFTYDLNHKMTRKWLSKVSPSINEGLKETKGLHVISTTIIDERHPIVINTSVNSTDTKSKEIGGHIDKLINEFFQNSQIKKEFPGSYEVIVLSEDNKKIN